MKFPKPLFICRLIKFFARRANFSFERIRLFQFTVNKEKKQKKKKRSEETEKGKKCHLISSFDFFILFSGYSSLVLWTVRRDEKYFPQVIYSFYSVIYKILLQFRVNTADRYCIFRLLYETRGVVDQGSSWTVGFSGESLESNISINHKANLVRFVECNARTIC